jgi:hypothetical protein
MFLALGDHSFCHFIIRDGRFPLLTNTVMVAVRAKDAAIAEKRP